jgi:tetratricopeptide (TPR) repeat protein
MVFGAWGAWVAPAFRADAIRFEARSMLDSLAAPQTSRATYADAVRRARAALDEAVRIDPTHAAAWADLAFATGLAANVTPEQQRALGQEAELQARRALALSAAPAEAWIRLGTALNLQGDWAGASRAYLHATVVAPHDANAWYYYADHLSRVFALYEATDAALRVCLRLDPGNPAGLALRQRLALTKKTP